MADDTKKDVTKADDASKDAKPTTVETPATPVVSLVEQLEQKVADKQKALTTANEAAVAAHGELMDAQRELARAKAS
jgi:hypothetical protein